MKLLTAGSLKVSELSAFLKASYEEQPATQIMVYTLDKKLLNSYGKIYFNNDIKKVIIAHRGTKETSDWANNAVLGVNTAAYKLTPRFKSAQKMVDSALVKYKGYQFEQIGHSQAGFITHLLADKAFNNISLNPAYKNISVNDNEYIIRSSADIVSNLSVPKKYLNSILYPTWTKSHMITIPAKSSNPITEHKVDILERLDPNMKIGRGGAIVKDKKLYDKVKKEIDIVYKKPSAYKSGAIQKKYKQLGGEYIEDNKPKNLKKWFKEKWINLANANQYPVLRPTKKINKSTPLTVGEITEAEIKKQIQLKQIIKGDKNLPKFKKSHK